MPRERNYWFPAKRYGWGWGPPVTWQGWVALLLYVAMTVTGAVTFPPAAAPVSFALSLLVPTAAFVAICYVTGERPRWRWGDDGRR